MCSELIEHSVVEVCTQTNPPLINLPGDNTLTRGGGVYMQETIIPTLMAGLLSDNVAQLDGGGI